MSFFSNLNDSTVGVCFSTFLGSLRLANTELVNASFFKSKTLTGLSSSEILASGIFFIPGDLVA